MQAVAAYVVFNHIKKPAKAGRKTQNLTYQVTL